jgi:hypothetical protein
MAIQKILWGCVKRPYLSFGCARQLDTQETAFSAEFIFSLGRNTQEKSPDGYLKERELVKCRVNSVLNFLKGKFVPLNVYIG